MQALVLFGAGVAAAPAWAQDTDVPAQDQPGTQPQTTAEDTEVGDTIIVTGSILRRTDAVTVSPVTTVTTEDLELRGISTVQDGLQRLSSNNGPALTNSFTANGAFAAGASAVSLRGLTTNSTLVLFDGLRAAYYPLADDGTRNFVDLNTIPDDIVERVEVLRDGASASYGADAIAGVVNIITKREFKGLQVRGEAGISERGDAGEYRLSATAGFGDLEDNGANFYMSGFYYNQEGLRANQRPYPYNTDDLRNVCSDRTGETVCGPNNVINGLDGDGNFPNGGTLQASPFIVRPYDATNTTALGRFVQLEAGCRGLPSYTLTAAELAASNNASVPTTVCQEDLTQLYGNITPNIERFGFSARGTARINDEIEAYAEVNFLQSKVNYEGIPATIRASAPTGINFPRFSTSTTGAAFAPGSFALTLPVYVCPQGVGSANGLGTGCDATNGVLNPNNPFAASGQVARILGRLPLREFNETRTRAYRAAFGVTGPITDNIDFEVKGTAMHVDLRRTSRGYVYIQNLLDAIAQGTYNFVNPELNSDAVNDFIAPEDIGDSSSDLYQIEGVVTSTLADLAGGPLLLGVGGSVRYEAVDNPSGNPDNFGPTERYFRQNAFGATGDRTVWSAYAEISAPIIEELELTAAGRYDNYSSGQSNFSPKFGFKFQPIPQVVVRGTYSEGFRIPSFGESNALPTTGFVNATPAIYTDEFLAQYGCSSDTYEDCPTYIRNASYGLTSLSTPDLEPEKSRSFTLGILVEPIRNVSLSVDYYNIRKTGAITTNDTTPAIDAYYAGEAIPAGLNVIPDAPDPAFPDAQPRIGFVESGFINANEINTEGLEFNVNGTFDFTDSISWTTSLDATYIINLSTEFPDGSVQSYEGTIGNYNLTAGSGTPEWRGTFQNVVDFGTVALVGTLEYFDGYDLSAEDQTGPDTAGQCGLAEDYSECKVEDYITFDLGANVEINEQFTFNLTVRNLFDRLPPIDTVTYGAHLYNPVQGGTGILGRYLKAGIKANF